MNATASHQLHQMIDKLTSEDPNQWGNSIDGMKKASTGKYREYIRETLLEYTRKGNFIRIYPAKGSDMYD